MAIAYVQPVASATAATTGTSFTANFIGNTTAGNRVVLVIGTGSGVTVTSVTDSQSNTYTIDASSTGANQNSAVVSALLASAVTTSDTYTVNLSATNKPEVAGAEYSGIATSSPVESSNTSTSGSSGATTTGNKGLTPAAATSELFSGVSTASTTATGVTDSNGNYTQRVWSGSNALLDDLNNTGTTLIQGVFNWTGSGKWAWAGVVYKASSTATGVASLGAAATLTATGSTSGGGVTGTASFSAAARLTATGATSGGQVTGIANLSAAANLSATGGLPAPPTPTPMAVYASTAGTRNPLTYVCYDLVTGAYKGRIPLAGVTFGSQLLTAGSCSGTIDIASPAVQALGPLDLTAPARTCLAIDYMGALVWGGVIWPRNYKYDSTTRQLQVTATELWSYPGSQRVQATDYSAPPYSGFTGDATKMAIWDATNTDADSVYDPVLIAWQLLYDALTQVNYGNILGGLSIAANGYTTPDAYLASGTNTPVGDYLSVNYPYASIQQLGTAISQLAQNGLGVGFDYAVDIAYSAGPGSPPVGTVNLSYPRRGRTYANNHLVLNCGQALSYELPEDGTQTGNTVYEQGSSGSLSVSQNIEPLQGGYPVLELIESRSNITSANMMNVLAMLGVADLATLSYPVSTPSVTMDLFSGSVPLGEFIVGDDVRWLVPATGGDGQIFDPRLPTGLDEEWRITGYSATVNDDGQSTIQFTLALPPSLTIAGPALP